MSRPSQGTKTKHIDIAREKRSSKPKKKKSESDLCWSLDPEKWTIPQIQEKDDDTDVVFGKEKSRPVRPVVSQRGKGVVYKAIIYYISKKKSNCNKHRAINDADAAQHNPPQQGPETCVRHHGDPSGAHTHPIQPGRGDISREPAR
jgi:hypothetical protein